MVLTITDFESLTSQLYKLPEIHQNSECLIVMIVLLVLGYLNNKVTHDLPNL